MLARRSALVLKVGVSCGMKMAICFASYSQTRLRQGHISRLYCSKRCLSRPSLVTRRSALILKWVCRMDGEAFKRRLVHGFMS